VGLFKRKTSKVEQSFYTGIKVNKASNAAPIPILYGCHKIGFNFLYYDNFHVDGYWEDGKWAGFQYAASIGLGLCEGVIDGIEDVWLGSDWFKPWTLSGWGWSSGWQTNRWPGIDTIFYGTDTQSSTYMGYPPLRGLAYVRDFYAFGQQPVIGDLTFNVRGRLFDTRAATEWDADPAEVIYDFLTNSQFGVGIPAAAIDDASLRGADGTASLKAYCRANGIGFSPALTERETASEILSRWLKICDSTTVWSGGKLKFVPNGGYPVTGNLYWGGSASYVPNVDPVYALTDDDFVLEEGSDEDPVRIRRKDPYELGNVIQIEWSSREKQYDSVTLEVFDQASIDLYGRRDGTQINAQEICTKAVAQRVAQLALQRGIYIRNTYIFRVSAIFCLLEPMDIVTITHRPDILGLDATPVRILSIDERDGYFEIEAEDYNEALGRTVLYPTQDGLGNPVSSTIVPSSVNPPIFLLAPEELTGGLVQLWIAASGGLQITQKLAETTANAAHLVEWPFNSRSAGERVQISCYLRAAERSKAWLYIFDGAAYQGASFDLAARTSFYQSGGALDVTVDALDDGWSLCSVACLMAANATALVGIQTLDASGNGTYPGTAGFGVHVWRPMVGFGSNVDSTVSIPFATYQATFTEEGLDPPLGVEGTGDPYYGGCYVWVSSDGASYQQIGAVYSQSQTGSLVANESGGTINVSLVESGGTLEPYSAAAAAAGLSLCLVDQELLAYETAVLTAPSTYTLGGLVRPLYHTTQVTHLAGDRFAFLNHNALLKWDVPLGLIGETLYFKFQSFNVFRNALQDLATCKVYTYTPSVDASSGLTVARFNAGFTVDLGLITEIKTQNDDLGTLTDPIAGEADLGDL